MKDQNTGRILRISGKAKYVFALKERFFQQHDIGRIHRFDEKHTYCPDTCGNSFFEYDTEA